MKKFGMAHDRAPIDWLAFDWAAVDWRLLELLAKLRRERWAERDKYGSTLLHYACRGPNVAAAVALLQSGLVDVNTRNEWGSTPAHWAAVYSQPRVLEMLCAAGADVRASNFGYTPIDWAAENVNKDGGETVRVFVANGVRLSSVREGYRRYITPELKAFERGILRCRVAVVAMLRVKKVAKLYHVDKFLMRELAYVMWATRTDQQWQK